MTKKRKQVQDKASLRGTPAIIETFVDPDASSPDLSLLAGIVSPETQTVTGVWSNTPSRSRVAPKRRGGITPRRVQEAVPKGKKQKPPK